MKQYEKKTDKRYTSNDLSTVFTNWEISPIRSGKQYEIKIISIFLKSPHSEFPTQTKYAPVHMNCS